MINGPAQGRSSRVVGYTYNGGTATLQVVSFDGLVPNAANGVYLGDQFIINGRPFSGTGFGFNLQNSSALNTATPVPTVLSPPYSGAASTGPLLNALEAAPTPVNLNKPPATGMPYAFLPNHAQIQLTPLVSPQAPYYYDPAGPGGAMNRMTPSIFRICCSQCTSITVAAPSRLFRRFIVRSWLLGMPIRTLNPFR